MTSIIFRKIGSIILLAVLGISLIMPVESHGASSFKDIKGHWAEKFIETAVDQGIIKGYPDGRFLPDEKVSRSEFISMMNRALGNTSTSNIGFKDVASGAWYHTDVSKAVTAGYVSGFGDNTFRPNNKITRQEAAVMLSRVVPAYGYSANLRKHSDYRSIADWAYTAMSKVSGKGYISGYTDGSLRPLDSLTRAQAAKIISDIITNETIVTTDPLVKKDGTKLSNRIYSNNVTIHRNLDDGDVSVDNCVILGKLIVQGGGDDTITLNNSRVANAVVDRSEGAVRLLAKGETSILNTLCSEDFILQTSGLSGDSFGTGFERVNLSSSSSGTLQGNFPYVSIDGSSAELKLVSGTISELEVKSAGRRSDITVENKATVSLANVYGESYFHGSGTISNMNVYAKGVTYETKPKKWSIQSGGQTPTQEDPELAISFDPAGGTKNVYRDTKIVITFNSAMREEDGSSITNSEIPDIVSIRKNTASGSKVDFTGTINSAKTVMTLTPSSPLDEDTRYYIVVKARTMIDAKGEENDAETSYFTTGDDTEKLIVTYSPDKGDTVSMDRRSFTITFSEGIKKYSGSTISTNDSYLRNDVVLFQRGGSAVKTSDYSVSINSSKTRITITLDDDYDLTLNTKYTVGIRSSKLKTSDGTNVPASSVSWTTAGTPALSSVSAVPYELAVDLKFAPSVSGKIYAVLLNGNAATPTAAQIRDGKDAAGNTATASANMSVSASKATTLKLTGENMERDTSYKIFAVLYDGSSNASSVISTAVTTEPLKLKKLTVIPNTGTSNIITGFQPDKTSYGKIALPSGTEYVSVTAEANDPYFSGDLTINAKKTATDDIYLVDGKAVISVIVKEAGKQRSVTYSVEVVASGSAALKSVTINGDSYDTTSGATYSIGAEPVQVTLIINTVDANAKIRIGSSSATSGVPVSLILDSTVTELNFTVESADGLDSKIYKIRFDRKVISDSSDTSEEI